MSHGFYPCRSSRSEPNDSCRDETQEVLMAAELSTTATDRRLRRRAAEPAIAMPIKM